MRASRRATCACQSMLPPGWWSEFMVDDTEPDMEPGVELLSASWVDNRSTWFLRPTLISCRRMRADRSKLSFRSEERIKAWWAAWTELSSSSNFEKKKSYYFQSRNDGAIFKSQIIPKMGMTKWKNVNHMQPSYNLILLYLNPFGMWTS